MSYYRVLLLIHILAGIAWVGAAFVIQVTVYRALRTGGQEAADRVLGSFRWADDWLSVLAPLLVVATGIAMVIDRRPVWAFTQAWVYLSLGLVVVYEGIALTAGGRVYRRMTTAREEGGVVTSGYGDTLRTYLRLGTVFLVFLVAIVVLMVFKPGL